MLAYVLIKGFNTGVDDAEALQRVFQGIPIKMDLIDVTDLTGKYQPPHDAERHSFFDAVQILKAPIARRYSGGKDIGAACGTLAGLRSGGTLVPAAPTANAQLPGEERRGLPSLDHGVSSLASDSELPPVK